MLAMTLLTSPMVLFATGDQILPWVIGFLVGIKMIMAGWSYIALALGSHHHHHPSTSMRPA